MYYYLHKVEDLFKDIEISQKLPKHKKSCNEICSPRSKTSDDTRPRLGDGVDKILKWEPQFLIEYLVYLETETVIFIYD